MATTETDRRENRTENVTPTQTLADDARSAVRRLRGHKHVENIEDVTLDVDRPLVEVRFYRYIPVEVLRDERLTVREVWIDVIPGRFWSFFRSGQWAERRGLGKECLAATIEIDT